MPTGSGTTVRLVTTAILLSAAPALAQVNLFSNAGQPDTVGLSTGPVTSSGVAAPSGSFWSELQDDTVFSSNAVCGVGCHSLNDAGAYRLAEDFAVSGEFGWRVDYASFYVYQPGWSQSAAPFAGVNVRIWSGVPGEAGSQIVWGDATTNRFVGAMATSYYRVFHTTMPPFPPVPNTSRRVWRVIADLGGVVLPPGEYWIDWQITNVVGSGEALSPSLPFVGLRGRAGANSRQWRPSFGGEWHSVIDEGKPSPVEDVPQEFPFMLAGVGRSCSPDFDGDGFLSGADFDLFVEAFESGVLAADFDSDGFITGADFDAFVGAFESGC